VAISASPLFRSTLGKSFLEQIVTSFERAPIDIREIRVGIKAKDLRQAKYLASGFNSQIPLHFLVCENTSSPLETVRKLLEGEPEGRQVLLQLGDTFAEFDWSAPMDNPVGAVVTKDSLLLPRLATLMCSDSGELIAEHAEPDISASRVGLLGVYWFPKKAETLDQTANPLESLLFADQVSKPTAVEATQWIDADYSDRFAVQNELFESRNFNSVRKDSLGILVTKSSSHKDKLLREHHYISSLPNKIAGLFPSVRSFEMGEDAASMEMDYWPFPNLSDLYCNQDLSEDFWLAAMSKIRSAMDLLHSEGSGVSSDGEFAFGKKVLTRLDELGSIDEKWRSLVEATVRVNGTVCRPARDLVIDGLEALADEVSAKSVVHGDFCFSNILLDTQTLTIKLIDPRGGFLNPSIFGPKFYDPAKLAHSVIGGYDLMLKGKYELTEKSSTNFEIRLSNPPHHAFVTDAFMQSFTKTHLDRAKLKLASALILISIPPLHLEDVSRAQAFLLKGIHDAEEALAEINHLRETLEGASSN
jgi:hypothetical protein